MRRSIKFGTSQRVAVAALVAASMMAAALRSGNAAQTEFDIETTVDSTCTVSPEFNNIQTVNISGITDAAGKIKATNTPVSLGTITCNAGSTLSLKSANGGLKRDSFIPTTPPIGFTDVIPYIASTTFGGSAISLDTNAEGNSAVSATTPVSVTGPMQLSIKTTANTTITAMEGTYKDTLTVKVGAPL